MSLAPKQAIKGTISGEQSVKGTMKEMLSLDNTLTKESYAADAKATGEAISKALTDANTYTDTHTRPNTWMPTANDVGAVPTSTTVNGKALSSNISLSAQDVGARPDTWTPTAADVGARPNTWTPSASDVGALPLGGGVMHGNVDMNGKIIYNVPTPNGWGDVANKGYVDGLDAANKKYVSDELEGRLPVVGGTMNGPINMGGNVIWGLGNPTGYDQAVPYRLFLDELAKKAPEGYGLGGSGEFLDSGTNFDDVTGSGFYSWNNGCINSPFDWGTMIAVSRHGGPVQLALGHDGEARDQIAIRSLSNGTSNWQYLMKRFNLLWQNASPNSLFGAQTISVDLNAYDTVMITYNQYYENNNVAMCFVPKFCYGQLETVMSGGRYRTLFVGNEGVTFENQLMADGSAGSNNFCIPSQIFGCKLA